MSTSETILHEDDEGQIAAVGNELLITDKNADQPDPVAVRMRSNNETIGKWSVDAFRNGRWREIGRIDVKRDERGRTNQAHADALEVNVWTHIPGHAFEDVDYKLVFGIRHDGPVFYVGTGAPPSPLPHMFASDDGKYRYNVQGDPTLEYPLGRIVQYRTNGSDDAAQWTPVAILRPEPL